MLSELGSLPGSELGTDARGLDACKGHCLSHSTHTHRPLWMSKGAEGSEESTCVCFRVHKIMPGHQQISIGELRVFVMN